MFIKVNGQSRQNYIKRLWQRRCLFPDDGEKSLLEFARKTTGVCLIDLEALNNQQAHDLVGLLNAEKTGFSQ